jgi:hypothetical protein
MLKPTSVHVACVISIGSKIPRFQEQISSDFIITSYSTSNLMTLFKMPGIYIHVGFIDSATMINAKFKNLRTALKLWEKNLPCLKYMIAKVNSVIYMLDTIEEFRTLSLEEWNLRNILKSHVITLLQNKKGYWKQRGKSIG